MADHNDDRHVRIDGREVAYSPKAIMRSLDYVYKIAEADSEIRAYLKAWADAQGGERCIR